MTDRPTLTDRLEALPIWVWRLIALVLAVLVFGGAASAVFGLSAGLWVAAFVATAILPFSVGIKQRP